MNRAEMVIARVKPRAALMIPRCPVSRVVLIPPRRTLDRYVQQRTVTALG